MATVSVQGIEKAFGATPVLKGVSLDIADGEFLTLVGPSGCGKSTLLRIIAGLERQDAGDVSIAGRLVNDLRASARDLAMVFQSYALYPHLTVRENMATPLRLRDLSAAQRLPLVGRFLPGAGAARAAVDASVRQAAETLKIEHLLDRKPGQLSGGQRQRAALGRAMVRQPAAFLMDEPLSNLDAALRVHMRAELADLHRSLNATFIYVTHDQAEALTMSDRMAVMMEGDLLQVGSPEALYLDPQDRRVAEFVGSPKINMLPAEIDRTGRVSALGVTLLRQADAPAGECFIGLRPEHLELSETSKGGEEWAFDVRYKENLGSDFFLHGRLNGADLRVIARATPEAAFHMADGARAYLRPTPGHALLFGQDGKRIPFREAAPVAKPAPQLADA